MKAWQKLKKSYSLNIASTTSSSVAIHLDDTIDDDFLCIKQNSCTTSSSSTTLENYFVSLWPPWYSRRSTCSNVWCSMFRRDRVYIFKWFSLVSAARKRYYIEISRFNKLVLCNLCCTSCWQCFRYMAGNYFKLSQLSVWRGVFESTNGTLEEFPQVRLWWCIHRVCTIQFKLNIVSSLGCI